MKNKQFDCIAMKRAAQQAIRAKVRGMTRKEEVAFFREGADDFERRLREAKRHQERPLETGQDR